MSLKLVLRRAWASGYSVMNWNKARKEKNLKSKVSEKIKHRDHDNSLSKWKSSKVEKKFQRLQICKECVEKMTQNGEVNKCLFFNNSLKARAKIFYLPRVKCRYLLSIVILYIIVLTTFSLKRFSLDQYKFWRSLETLKIHDWLQCNNPLVRDTCSKLLSQGWS